jgi:type I restriction enzyme S subunit
MIGVVQKNKRAFAVWFEDLERWNPGSFVLSTWHWPKEYIAPISTAIERKKVEANPQIIDFRGVQTITLHFNGEVVQRNGKDAKDFKGKLFIANPGDVIYSKIDVRNGAIGIVPDAMQQVCVSSEFPVYSVKSNKAFPQYIKLLFRTEFFRKTINSLISGTSGRKRVQPEQLEAIEIPLPPLHVQQTIVGRWQKVQEEIRAAYGRIEETKQAQGNRLIQRLQIELPPAILKKGAFIIDWKELERWDTFFYREDFTHLEKQLLSMRHARLGEILNFTSRSWKATDFPSGDFEYIEISSVTRDDGIIGSRTVKINEAPSRATTLLKDGDVILATTRPYLGAFAIVPQKYNNCVCSSGFALADAIKIPDIEKEFLLLFLKSPAGLRQMERRMTGGLYPAIVQDELEKILVPIPPLKLQREIIQSVIEGCSKIQHEREASELKAREIKAEIEALILGTKRIDI